MRGSNTNNLVTLAFIALAVALATTATASAANPPEGDAYAQRKAFYEQHWQAKIESALSYVSGVVVTVNVDLSTELEHVEESEEFSGEPVAVERAVKVTERTERSPATRMIPVTMSAVSDSGSNPATSENAEETSVRSVVPLTTARTTHAGLVPEAVSVAICVPRSYYEAVWRRRHPNSTSTADKGKELESIQEEMTKNIYLAVGMLLPRKHFEDDVPWVRVISFEDLEG